MEGEEWIRHLVMAQLVTSLSTIILSAAVMFLASCFRSMREHMQFLQSYLVQARAADLNMLLRMLAIHMDKEEPGSREHRIIEKLMISVDEAKAAHAERHMTDGRNQP